VPGCRADFQCELGSVCAFLKCNQGCHSNADCEPGTFCSAPPGSEFIFGRPPPRCKPGCHDDGECAPAELCSEGVCHLSCLETSDCGAEGYCASLHALGSVRMDAGLPVECGTGERCACIRAPNADSGRASP
jgi:hypothetical protein